MEKIEKNLNKEKLGLGKKHFARKRKTNVVCMPYCTCICISLLHKLILYNLEDQKLLL